jgi:hypothetical protein
MGSGENILPRHSGADILPLEANIDEGSDAASIGSTVGSIIMSGGSTIYRWKKAYAEQGIDGLVRRKPIVPGQVIIKSIANRAIVVRKIELTNSWLISANKMHLLVYGQFYRLHQR